MMKGFAAIFFAAVMMHSRLWALLLYSVCLILGSVKSKIEICI